MQIGAVSDDIQIIQFASKRNVAPRILPDLVENVRFETGADKLVIIASNGGADTYCCGTDNLCDIMDNPYVKKKECIGSTVRTMVSTDNIIAVSYTHLDVYKRQVWSKSRKQGTASLPARSKQLCPVNCPANNSLPLCVPM